MNLLTPIIQTARRGKRGEVYVLYRCKCGADKEIIKRNVDRGTTRSCGCLQRQWALKHWTKVLKKRLTTHGETKGGIKTTEYRVWQSMKDRCENPRNIRFYDYGGRSIAVCKNWHNYENFLSDMGRRPGPDYSIERVNNSGNYEPSNCRWATRTEQLRNMRSNVHVLLNGNLVTVAEAAEQTHQTRSKILWNMEVIKS